MEKQRRVEVFLQARERVVRWDWLIKKIAAYDPKAGPKGGRRAYPMERMLRLYFLQNGYGQAIQG